MHDVFGTRFLEIKRTYFVDNSILALCRRDGVSKKSYCLIVGPCDQMATSVFEIFGFSATVEN